MEESEKTELIDRYLDDTLSPDETQIIQSRLERDPEFQLEVEAQRAVRSLLQAEGEKRALQKLMNEFHLDLPAESDAISDEKKLDSNKKDKKVIKLNWSTKSYMAIAASIALVVVGIWTVVQEKPAYNDFEVRHDLGTDMKRIPLLSWKTVDHKPTLVRSGFVNLKITPKTKNTYHYRFTSYLEIFSDTLSVKTAKISLQHEQTTGSYKLWIDKKSYHIIKTDAITALK